MKIKEVTNHVMFVYGAVFHPSIHPYRQGILDAALKLFGEESVAVMWKDTSGLSETELADLGFCKIAGSELIFRHSALRTPFHDAHPTGQNTDDAVAEPEHEEWVMQEWKRGSRESPMITVHSDAPDRNTGLTSTRSYVMASRETEAFYRTILGLTVIAKESGRHVFFHVGASQCSPCFHCRCHAQGRSTDASWS